MPHKLSPLHSGLMGTVFSDLFGYLFQSAREGYATVFLLESAIFGLAVFISLKLKFVNKKALNMKKFFQKFLKVTLYKR